MRDCDVVAAGIAAMVVLSSYLARDDEVVHPARLLYDVMGFLKDWRESKLKLDAYCWANGVEVKQVCDMLGVKKFSELIKGEK